MDTDMRGQFGGLGIEVSMEEVLKVAKPIRDTPASRAGILANDIIRQIDGERGQGLTLSSGGREDARADQHPGHASRSSARQARSRSS